MNTHYFVTTALHWSADEDLFKALKKNRKVHRKMSIEYFVYKVPVPISEPYTINGYRPEVKGVELIATGRYV
jgi:hypothetical protein